MEHIELQSACESERTLPGNTNSRPDDGRPGDDRGLPGCAHDRALPTGRGLQQRRSRTRRDLLIGASALASWLSRPSPVRADVPFSPTRWLVHRLTMGWTPEEQSLADSLGYQGYLEYHLNYTA